MSKAHACVNFYSILGAPPYDVQVEGGENGDPLVAIAIARSCDENCIVSLVCELAEATIDGETHWEFSFSFDIFSLDGTTEPFRTQDRNMAAAYIPREIHQKIMPLVCNSLQSLANHIKPLLIYWVTKDRELPEKAMQKYYLLREALEKIGYSLARDGTDPMGRCFCVMRQNTELTGGELRD